MELGVTNFGIVRGVFSTSTPEGRYRFTFNIDSTIGSPTLDVGLLENFGASILYTPYPGSRIVNPGIETFDIVIYDPTNIFDDATDDFAVSRLTPTSIIINDITIEKVEDLINLCINGDFSIGGSNWTEVDVSGGNSITYNNEFATSGVSVLGKLHNSVSLEIGETYAMMYDLTTSTPGQIIIAFKCGTNYGTSQNSTGSYTDILVADTNLFGFDWATLGGGGGSFTIDNIRLYKLS